MAGPRQAKQYANEKDLKKILLYRGKMFIGIL